MHVLRPTIALIAMKFIAHRLSILNHLIDRSFPSSSPRKQQRLSLDLIFFMFYFLFSAFCIFFVCAFFFFTICQMIKAKRRQENFADFFSLDNIRFSFFLKITLDNCT